MFVIAGHGLEALFKIITDQGVFYFVDQKNSLSRVALNEDLFQSTIDTFLSLHQ